jgi:O-antigen/teichoic acid export membrane protein
MGIECNRVLQQLAARAPWVAGSKAFSIACIMVSNVMLARLLKPAELGTYFFMVSVAAVGSVFARLGVAQTGLRLIAAARGAGRPDEAWKSVLSSLCWTTLGALVTALLFCTVGVRAGLEQGLAAMLATLAGLQAFHGVLVELLRGYGRIKEASVCGGPANQLLFVFLLLSSLFTGGRLDLAQVLGCLIIATALAVLLTGRVLYRGRNSVESHPDREKSYIPEAVMPAALPIMASNLALAALSQADIWILTHFLPRADVALYGTMVRMATAVSLPLFIVNSSLSPTMAEYHVRGDAGNLERSLRRITTIASILSFAVVACFALAGTPLISIVFGDFYRQGYVLLLVLCVGQFATVATGPCGSMLAMSGNQRSLMIISVMNGMLTLATAVLLARMVGVAGVAFAMAGGMIIQNILTLLAVRRSVGIWTHLQITGVRET